MPSLEAPSEELGSGPRTPSIVASPTPSEISSTSTPEPQNVRPSPLFRALAIRPPEPEQPQGQDELERRLPGYQRIVIPRDLTLIELLKQSSGVETDEEVLRIREIKLRVIAERVGLRRLHVLAPHLRCLTLDGSALGSLRDLGIGLVHLKILSVNRCGLTCLDGVWGLPKLRELHAAANKLQDLHPLAALQKLHTLDLANNPISDAGRLWTLAVCSSLRSITLRGTPASDQPDYIEQVAAALPSLTHLDDMPLHDENPVDIVEDSGSESEGEQPVSAEHEHRMQPTQPPAEPEPGTSQEAFEDFLELVPDGEDSAPLESQAKTPPRPKLHQRHRPATTENAGLRPERPGLPKRPKTASERPTIDAPSRLQIMNTLMDEEWRCSGSELTSHGAVCGNLARALRRPMSARFIPSGAEMAAETIRDATRMIAAEIPRAPGLEDWDKFREQTGIDIQIDFNQWPRGGGDPESAIARLERIEKETRERLKEANSSTNNCDLNFMGRFQYGPNVTSDYQTWKVNAFTPVTDTTDVNILYNELDRTDGDEEVVLE